MVGIVSYPNSIESRATFLVEKQKTLYIVYQYRDGIRRCLCDLKPEFAGMSEESLAKINDSIKYEASYYPKKILKRICERGDIELVDIQVPKFGGMHTTLMLFGKTLPKDSYFTVQTINSEDIIRITIQAANVTDWREITTHIDEVAKKNKIIKVHECMWDLEAI